MPTRAASCRCAAVTALCEGYPVRVSVCHCLACQQRTGSAFGAQARFETAKVTVSGETRTYVRITDSGNRTLYRFCPSCGSTVVYQAEQQPEFTAVPLGAFADPGFSPHPTRSVYEARQHAWVAILGDDIEHER